MSKYDPELIASAANSDERGFLISYNTFDMDSIRRMYLIRPASTRIVRAWQAHRLENKWFYCTAGSFEVKLVAVSDFVNPADDPITLTFNLEANSPHILHIPGGYANGFRATAANSNLLVFSNNTLAESKSDDFRYAADKWNLWEK